MDKNWGANLLERAPRVFRDVGYYYFFNSITPAGERGPKQLGAAV